MFAKCAFVVVAVGACGCGLLALRQSRLQVASELARTQMRIAAADERLWALRTRIADRVSPRNVERMAAVIGPLKPIMDPLPVGPSEYAPPAPIVNGVPPPGDRVARTPVAPAADPRPKVRVASHKPAAKPAAPAKAAKGKSTPGSTRARPKNPPRATVIADATRGTRP